MDTLPSDVVVVKNSVVGDDIPETLMVNVPKCDELKEVVPSEASEGKELVPFDAEDDKEVVPSEAQEGKEVIPYKVVEGEELFDSEAEAGKELIPCEADEMQVPAPVKDEEGKELVPCNESHLQKRMQALVAPAEMNDTETIFILSSDDEALGDLEFGKTRGGHIEEVVLISSDDEDTVVPDVSYVSNTPSNVQVNLKSENVDEVTPSTDLSLVPVDCTPSSRIPINLGTPLSCLGSHGSNNSGSVVENVVEGPKVGMTFATMNEVEVYYKCYAKQVGFGVSRVAGSYFKSKAGDKQRRSCLWKCEYYGSPDTQKSGSTEVSGTEVVDEAKSKRTSKKCGCDAMIYASINKLGVWEIRKVELNHSNHVPTPTKSTLVKEYRMESFTKPLRRRLLNDLQSGLSVAKIHGCLALERNGIQNMVVTKQDMRHVAAQHRRLKMVGGDANAMLQYFEKMQKDNQQFFHSHRLDENGVMKDVVWVDARSRAAYEEFGDVVCFDATYLTNRYDLPFANFVGVNHHGQSILLGCALVSTEDTETYKWVFHQWVLCMGGRKPNAILTDQAQPMKNAIEEVMPETRHRWCIWHIMGKVPRKLGGHERYDELSVALKEVVYDTHSPEEFEENWGALLVKYDLQNDVWLTKLYADRLMWVPAFLNDIFWAGMRTTQRVESINSFFDKYVTRHTKLYEFAEKYCAAMEQRVKDELDEDLKSMKYVRKIVSGYRFERVFQRVYTSRKFRDVQKQCERVTFCVPKKEQSIGEFVEHLLEDRVWVIPKGKKYEVVTNKRRFYKVRFNTITKQVLCQCKMFETQGILCRHGIRVLDQHLHGEVPKMYILRRWRKDVSRKHSKVKVAYHDPTKNVEVRRYDRMMVASEQLCEFAKEEDATMNMVLDGLKMLTNNVTNYFVNYNASQCMQSPQINGSQNTTKDNEKKPKKDAKDPKIPKKRGRPATKRKENVDEHIRKASKKKKVDTTKDDPPVKLSCVRVVGPPVTQRSKQTRCLRKTMLCLVKSTIWSLII